MAFELPKLPYAREELQPYISAKTIDYHYGKHHQAYVNNLNNLIVGTPYENATLEEIIRKADGGIFNNAAQVWNHTFYWEGLTPKKGDVNTQVLNKLNQEFGSFEAFKEKFSHAAATLFGSGWAWLSMDQNGKFVITQESNAGNPLRSGLKPVLTCDVWEHAYYIDRLNARPDYIKNFWEIVNWNKVLERIES